MTRHLKSRQQRSVQLNRYTLNGCNRRRSLSMNLHKRKLNLPLNLKLHLKALPKLKRRRIQQNPPPKQNILHQQRSRPNLLKSKEANHRLKSQLLSQNLQSQRHLLRKRRNLHKNLRRKRNQRVQSSLHQRKQLSLLKRIKRDLNPQ